MRSRLAVLALVMAGGSAAVAQDSAPTSSKKAADRRIAGPVRMIAVSPDGKWVAASDSGSGLTIFSTEGDAKRVVFKPDPIGLAELSKRFVQLVFTSDLQFLVVVPIGDVLTGAQAIRIVSVADGGEARSIDVSDSAASPGRASAAEGGSLSSLDAEPRGSKLRLWRQRSVEVWDAATGEKTNGRANLPFAQYCVDSADGSVRACSTTTKLWVADAATGARRWSMDLEEESANGGNSKFIIRPIGFSSDASKALALLSPSASGPLRPTSAGAKTEPSRIQAYDAATGKAAWRRDVTLAPVLGAVAAASGAVAVVGAGKIQFFDAGDGRPLAVSPPKAEYLCVAAAQDGAFWAGTADNRVLKVRDSVKTK